MLPLDRALRRKIRPGFHREDAKCAKRTQRMERVVLRVRVHMVSSGSFKGGGFAFQIPRRCCMPKYLIQASYTAEGLQGLIKDKASGRRAAVSRALEAIGGKTESIYYTFGDYDVILIADIPDNVSAAAMSIRVSGSGLVRTKTTPLLTVEETDRALEKTIAYRPPGI